MRQTLPSPTLTLCALALLGVTALPACNGRRPAPKPTLLHVSVITASQGAVHPVELFAGIIAPTQSVGIQSALAEPADEVDVKEGDYVTRGQLLARLDTADLQAALDADLAMAASDEATTTHTAYAGTLAIEQGTSGASSALAAVRQAQANLSRDRTDLHRDEGLLGHGYIAQQQVDQLDTTVRTDEEALRSAQAALASAESNVKANGTLGTPGLQSSALAQARAAQHAALAQAEQERVQIAKALITAPVDGVVVNRNLNPGEYPGTRQLFTIQKVDPVYAVLHGSGMQIAEIAEGASASINVGDLRGRSFEGKVLAVLNQIVPGSTNFEVKVRLPNPQRVLRPGMAVEGRVRLPTRYGVRVPLTAFTDDTHTGVLTVDDEGVVRSASVAEIGDDARNAVVSGVEPGTRVIADGQSGASSGEHVAVR